jgi:hypothetical protein
MTWPSSSEVALRPAQSGEIFHDLLQVVVRTNETPRREVSGPAPSGFALRDPLVAGGIVGASVVSRPGYLLAQSAELAVAPGNA